ncbi:MAG: hypothetical protein KatS3mg108_1753 [Isosphaeraceae bacterium]|nr:MAG: hypothetical protein KatS3mg108_1753 [Isosphaeraceae bacterium]
MTSSQWRINAIWNRLRRLVGLAALVYLGLVVMLYAFQTHLIFPGSATQGHPASRLIPPRGCELLRIRTSTGAWIRALFGPALSRDGLPDSEAPTRPTILFFYGNGMCLATSLGEFEAFRRLGANVLIPDYLGYGLSQGEPSEAGCYATAEACYEALRSRRDVDPDRIVAAGWSLGGAVAIDLAARRPTAGLAVFSSFTSLAEVVRGYLPWVPAGWLLRHRFESERKISRVRCPILIGHSRDDELIRFAMAERLAHAAGGPVELIAIDGAPHNAFFDVGWPSVEEGMIRLLGRVAGENGELGSKADAR